MSSVVRNLHYPRSGFGGAYWTHDEAYKRLTLQKFFGALRWGVR